MKKISKVFLSVLFFTFMEVNLLSAQTIQKNDELNNYIEYLITSARETDVNYKLVIENASYLLQASHYTYNNYLTSSAKLPEDGIDKISFMNKRAREISTLRSNYNENNLKNKALTVPKVIAETMQEYITVSNTVIFQMSENAHAFSTAAQAQYELVAKFWAAKVARDDKQNFNVKIHPDLKSFSPGMWENEQNSIKTGLSKQYDLYLKLVKSIEKLQDVKFDRSFKIANQNLIREEIEKNEAEEKRRINEELGSYKISTGFQRQYRVLDLVPMYNVSSSCDYLTYYTQDLASKGFEQKSILKLKNLCGQFNKEITKDIYNRLVAYYITDLISNDGKDVRTLIWIPKDENKFLEKEYKIFTDSEGFILLGNRLQFVSGKINTPESKSDTLIIGKHFRNEENKTKFNLFTYSNKLFYLDAAAKKYLKILAANNKSLDSLFETLYSNSQLPDCIKDYDGYINIAKEKKRMQWTSDCRQKIDGLIAYKLLQFNEWNTAKAKVDFYDVYWIPGDENQSKDISVRPLTKEGYLVVFKGSNHGHFIEKLKRSYD